MFRMTWNVPLIPGLFALTLLASPAWGEGPPHDPQLQRVLWEMGETERSPRVMGWAVEFSGGKSIVLSESWPEGYRIELTLEEPLGSTPFHASDNATGRMGATLSHPGGACSVGPGKNPRGERVQMFAMPMGEASVGGSLTLTVACYGSTRPLGIQVSIVPDG